MDVRDNVYKLVNHELSFLDSLCNYDREKLIDTVRQSPLREKVLSICFDELKERYPYYLFRIVCDMEEYKDFCIEYLDNNFTVLNDSNFFGRYFIGSTKWSLEYLMNNLNRLIELDTRIIFITLRYAMDFKNEEFINLLLFNDNLELRGKVMVELMSMSPYRFMEYYSDLIGAFVKYDEKGNAVDIVSEKYVSRIAYDIVDNDLGIDNYDRVKNFILSNYETNTLASRLDGVNVDEELGIDFGEHIDVLLKDIDDLFRTSGNYKYRLFIKYTQKLNPDLKKEFYNAIKDFISIDENIVDHMFKVGLGDKFIEFTKRYMELSTGAKVVGNAGMGSCTRAFIVGDYVVKCSYKKWLTTRCPDLFLVARNYEEEVVRTHFGSIIGALEVQKYYHRAINPKDQRLIGKFHETLRELGYEFDDNVLGFNETPNIFYLDSYLEADTDCPEELPKWFKKDPIVLVDRDYVKKLSKDNNN